MRRPWLAIALSISALACDKSPFAPDEPPAPSEPTLPPRNGAEQAAKQVAAAEMEAGIVVEHSDPLPSGGDLQADIDSFSSLDSCVQQHANVDPLVGDAIRALGYDTLLRDSCRVVQAMKQKNASTCAGIAASGLQARCESLVAMAQHTPDKCPWIASSERTLGRDPLCLAIATQDPRTCGAVVPSQRATCEALATGDAKRCFKAAPEQRAACDRELSRERRALVPDEHEAHDAAPPKGKLELHGLDGAKDPDPAVIDLAQPLEAGVVIAADPVGGTRIDVAHDPDAALHLVSHGVERVRMEAQLRAEGGVVKVEHLVIDAPKAMPISCPGPHCDVKAELSKGDPTRGAPFTVTFDGKIDALGSHYTIHAKIDSFVRDVVTRTSMFMPR